MIVSSPAGDTALDRLTSIRSGVAEEVLAFLSGCAAALDLTPWTWPHTGQPILSSEVFVDLDVLTRARDPDVSSPGSRGGHVQETEAARYEVPTTTRRVDRVRWSHLLETPDRRILKGAPGSGKSFLSRHAAAQRLRSARTDLQSQRISLAELPATVWVSATALAAAAPDASVTHALVDAAVSSIDGGAPASDRVRAWLGKRLLDDSALVIVDGLDEVSPQKYAACKRRLRETGALPGQLLITCRTLQWELLKHDILPSLVAEEVEVAPLTSDQMRGTVRRLFLDESDPGARVLVLLQQNPGLLDVCTSPLRLLFVCLLARGSRLATQTTYAGLYTHLLRALVEGRWRIKRPRWTVKPGRVEHALSALTRIGWALFSSAPANNRFNLAAWTKAATTVPMEARHQVTLLDDLVALGVLAPAGFDELGDRCWSFAHRTLLEYLAARELASRPPEDWLAEMRRHIWFDAEWTEVWVFLASAVRDATPLLRVLDAETDDVFGSMLEMRSRVVGVAQSVASPRARRVTLAVLGMTLNRAAIVPAGRYERCVRVLGWRRLGTLLAAALFHHTDARARQSVAKALGELGSTEALSSLIHALTTDQSADVRMSAAYALRIIGAGEAAGALAQVLQGDSDDNTRRAALMALDVVMPDCEALLVDTLAANSSPQARQAAATALIQRNSPKSIDALCRAVAEDPRPAVRARAAGALGFLRATEAADLLFRAVVGDEGVQVRRSGARALRRLGRQKLVKEAVAVLTPLLHLDPDHTSQELAAAALGNLGSHGLESLVHALASRDRVTRGVAVAALGQIDDDGSIEPLVGTLRGDDDEWVRGAAAYWLGCQKPGARFAAVVESLVRALRMDSARYVRSSAAFALGELRAADAARALIDSLGRDADWLTRKEAALALGRIGDETAVDVLLLAARDDDKPQVRQAAAEALGAESWRINRVVRDARTTPQQSVLPGVKWASRAGERPLGWAPHAAIGLNNFGLQLREQRRLDESRELVHASLKLSARALGGHTPKLSHRLMNLAGVELLRGQHRRARLLLGRAWRHQVHVPDLTAARILTVRLAVAIVTSETRDIYVAQLRTIFDSPSLSDVAETDAHWSVAWLLDHVEGQVGAERSALLRGVAVALNDRSNFTLLQESREWCAARAIPLDQSWDGQAKA